MRAELEIDCIWIPSTHGGRRTEPHPGLRLGIRWQRHVQEHAELYRDVQVHELTVNPTTRHGIAVVSLIGVEPVPSDWLMEGELVELLEGFRVVAVARITNVRRGRSAAV